MSDAATADSTAPLERVHHLGSGDAVDHDLQGLVGVTLEDSFHTAGSGGDGLPHRHVQVVVVLLGSEVLKNRKQTRRSTLHLTPGNVMQPLRRMTCAK